MAVNELWPLLKRQHAEVAPNREAVPLDPDWDRYYEYERCGILKVWCARDGASLVGFVDCFLTHGLLCSSLLHGYAEHFYLMPEWRGAGREMLRSCADALVALGAKVVRFHTNDLYLPDEHGRSRVGLLFKRDGFKPIVTIWEKVIDERRPESSSEP